MSRHAITVQRTFALLTASVALFASSTTFAQTVSVESNLDQNGLRVLHAQNIVVSDPDDGESHTLEIRVVGDKVTVIRGGKEVSQPQITESDDKIIITDEEGKRLREIRFGRKGGDALAYYMGRADSEDRAATPPVMLGVNMTVPGPALEKHLRLEPNTTTMIAGVYEGLPAHEAGLREYDIIVKVDGESPADNETIRKILSKRKPGDSITFTVIQEGKQREVEIELKAYDATAMASAKMLGSAAQDQSLLLEQLKVVPRFFVSPDSQGTYHMGWEAIPPMLNSGPKSSESIEEKLQRLDERMAELETLLERLLERRESAR